LAERQWAQVRTPLFKKWFGDWETLAKMKNLYSAINQIVNGKEAVTVNNLGNDLQKLGGTNDSILNMGK
jgi:hypothetical protein